MVGGLLQRMEEILKHNKNNNTILSMGGDINMYYYHTHY